MDDVIVVSCPEPSCAREFSVDAGRTWRRVSCPFCAAEGAAILAEVRRELRTRGPRKPMPKVTPGTIAVVLEDLRSLHNVGSILRTCDAFGVDFVVMAGVTASADHPKMARTALGAERVVPWVWRPDGPSAVTELQEMGMTVVALERVDQARPLGELQVDRPFALVIGNEVGGVSGPVLARASYHVEIPMLGTKASLNAAVACAVALWHLNTDLVNSG